MVSLALVRYEPPPTREIQTRLLTLGRLRAEHDEIESAYERDRSALRDFEKRYKPAVGDRHQTLEDIRAQTARAWEQIRRARSGEPLDEKTGGGLSEELPRKLFNPKTELRQLFRELARLVHPDLASDIEERRRRHEFMTEGTRAYRAADHRRLQWLLEHWQATPALPPGWDPDSRLARTNQRIAWMRYRITEMNHLTAALHASPLAEIKREAEQARREGRNLIAELRGRVVRDLEQARADRVKVEETLAEWDESVVKIIRANAGL